MAVKSFFLLLLLYGIDWRFLVGLQQICYLKGLSVLICSDRIEERYILLHFLLRSQIHEYFIFNTPGRICRKLRLTIECEAVHGLPEPECTGGHIIVLLFVFWMEFFYDMSDKAHIPFNEFISRTFIAFCQSFQALSLFRFRERSTERLPPDIADHSRDFDPQLDECHDKPAHRSTSCVVI